MYWEDNFDTSLKLSQYLLTTQDYTNMDDQTTIYEMMMFKTIYNVKFIDSTQYFGIPSHLNHTFHNHLALEHTTHLQLLPFWIFPTFLFNWEVIEVLVFLSDIFFKLSFNQEAQCLDIN